MPNLKQSVLNLFAIAHHNAYALLALGALALGASVVRALSGALETLR